MNDPKQMNKAQLVNWYKKLLQLEFPEDAATEIIAAEDEILRRMGGE